MKISPTLLTAALAGMFSALVWPMVWTRFGGADAGGNIELIVGTLLVIAVPAHAFVVGFGHGHLAGPRALDAALLKRIAVWLLAAVVTLGASAAYRA